MPKSFHWKQGNFFSLHSQVKYIVNMRSCGKGKYQSTDNTKIGNERGSSYQKNEEISGWMAHMEA